MRDFRDAKAMAHSLRAALAAKGIKITVSQSLELIAQAFGTTDWNTLAAAIRRESPATPESTSPPQPATAKRAPPQFSAEFRSTLHRAIDYASQRKHEYTTLEHLLLALIEDVDASRVMKVCDVNLAALRENLASSIDNDLKTLVIDDYRKPKPTPAFQRVVKSAALHAQELDRETATGGDLLVAMFDAKESPAVWLLREQGITRQDAVNFILHGIEESDNAAG